MIIKYAEGKIKEIYKNEEEAIEKISEDANIIDEEPSKDNLDEEKENEVKKEE